MKRKQKTGRRKEERKTREENEERVEGMEERVDPGDTEGRRNKPKKLLRRLSPITPGRLDVCSWTKLPPLSYSSLFLVHSVSTVTGNCVILLTSGFQI